MINLKKKLLKNELTLGSWITLGHPAIPEIMSKAGFDWLAVDMEHSAINIDSAQQLIQVIELCGVVPLVRVSENDPCIIKRVMDAGAHGVIVPMVNTKGEAERAVAAVRYPPQGKRGVGLGRAQGYGFEFDQYKDWIQNSATVIVQIEHVESISNLEAILKTKGVDGSIIGPYDLSGSIGLPGDFTDPRVKSLIHRYEKVCRALGKPMGYHIVYPDCKKARWHKSKGYTFLAVGLDSIYIGQKCREVLENLK